MSVIILAAKLILVAFTYLALCIGIAMWLDRRLAGQSTPIDPEEEIDRVAERGRD